MAELLEGEDLRPWGYAPGSYMFQCVDCPKVQSFAQSTIGDKRSVRCIDHARARRDNPEPPKALQPTPYTIDQIDDAIRAIAGERAVRRGDYGWHRVHAMLGAAGQAWIDQRPEDAHSDILRTALKDLNKDGYLRPYDGKWP